MGFKPSICSAFAHFEFLRKIKILSNLKVFTNLTNAFSLVEMLMALLVASLLLAALAPVMTRRMADHELKVISEAANYDKDMVVSVFTESTKFNIPSDANQVRVTLVGGGGAGGDALYGNKEITSTQEFTVPDGVTKLRVFMIGAGGGGASGGAGTGIAYGSLTGTAGQQEYAGSSSANTGVKTWTIPSSAKGNVPSVDEKCIWTNPNSTWTLVSDASRTAKAGDTVVNVKACGGGGGGGGATSTWASQGVHPAGSGSSGGYINKQVIIPQNTSSISVTIGGGGGGGCNNDASNNATVGAYRGGGGGGWGGGGGGCETGSAGSGVSPGGNGAFCQQNSANNGYKANSGIGTLGGGAAGEVDVSPFINGYVFHFAAGSGSLEGGGGGGGASSLGGGGGGGGATLFGRYGNSSDGSFFLVAPGGGGGGGYMYQTSYTTAVGYAGGGGGGLGGGKGGNSIANDNNGGKATGGNSGYGGYGTTLSIGGASPLGDSNYCAGGNGGANGNIGASGKNGYMLISWAPAVDALKCSYSMPSNGGGGGGAGQIWIGELTVSPNQKLTFNIGKGGEQQTLPGSNGNNGTATSIASDSSVLISVSGGKGGKYESEESYIESSGGLGGGIKFTSSGSAKYVNWKKANLHSGGTAGLRGYLESEPQNGAGGNGGFVYNLKEELLQGGLAGGSNADGNNSPSSSYGAGGGGGGGGSNGSFGIGGKGANGYIYVEWGGSNGGGGTMGEIVKKTYTNLDPDSKNRVMDIKIGLGGNAKSSDYEFDVNEGVNGNGGTTSTSMISNGKTIKYEAKGGLRGNNGTSEENTHGSETKIPSNFSETYKEYVQGNMNIVLGQKGEDNYGGMGGYLSCLYQTKDEEGNSICTSTIKSNDGTNITLGPIRPGCGGTSILSPLYDSICNITNQTPSPNGNNGLYGAGGGGGAVLNQTGGKGGYGGNGFVILEYKSTTLD